MHRPDIELGERGYEPAHIKQVLAELEKNFPRYAKSFFRKPGTNAFADEIEKFEQAQPKYETFLDISGLEEYEDDPAAFKGDTKKNCPIIRRCLQSQEKEMELYKKKFNAATGQELLSVTLNIAKFGKKFMKHFDDRTHEHSKTVDDLGLSTLLEEGYTAYGVIGGGIRSHFLYSLYPSAFPNRSQNAVWALYFLSGKKDFGFRDASEFLMVEADKGVTQQNYHYPYDLFAFYALKLYLMLKGAASEMDYRFQKKYRYIYLDTFFEHVAALHHEDIAVLKRKDYEYTE